MRSNTQGNTKRDIPAGIFAPIPVQGQGPRGKLLSRAGAGAGGAGANNTSPGMVSSSSSLLMFGAILSSLR